MGEEGVSLKKIEWLRSLRGLDSLVSGKARPAPTPRPLGLGVSGGREIPAADGSLGEWALWSLDASAVGPSFWGLCLWAPDAQWGEAKAIYAARAEDVFAADRSMGFRLFCLSATDLALAGDDRAFGRFVALACESPWSGWVSGSMAPELGGSPSMGSGGGPPIVELYAKALGAAWDGSRDLAALVRPALEAWLGGSAPPDEAGEPAGRRDWSMDVGRGRELALALALSGVLSAPPGARRDEKEMAKALGLSMGGSERSILWAEALDKGEACARALGECWAPPEPKLLVGRRSPSRRAPCSGQGATRSGF